MFFSTVYCLSALSLTHFYMSVGCLIVSSLINFYISLRDSLVVISTVLLLYIVKKDHKMKKGHIVY